MGRRSRKRLADVQASGGHAAGQATRAERDLARRAGKPATTAPRDRRGVPGRTRAEDRPPPPWGRFPLNELLVLVALVLLVWGVIARRGPLLLAGLAIGSLGGLELSIREHFSGFRSHTTLLAGAVALVTIVAISFLAHGVTRLAALPIAGIVFLTAFWLLRQAFSRRSGGVGFRR